MTSLDLRPMETAERIPRLRAELQANGCDALLVTNLLNIRYLTGYIGTNARLLVTSDDALLTTDPRYGIAAMEQLHAAGVDVQLLVLRSHGDEVLAMQRFTDQCDRIGLESLHIPWGFQQVVATKWFELKEVVPVEGLIESQRVIKDRGEIDRVAAACRISCEALEQTEHLLWQEPTEAEFSRILENKMRELGADGSGFEMIVASGPNAASAHHCVSDRKIEVGEAVVIDFGALVDGYRSDMSRTLCAGKPRDPSINRMHEVAVEAQAAGVKSVHPGTTVELIHQTCRDIVVEAGWQDGYPHGTVHGVGLEIHEPPIGTGSVGSNYVITVEPGVYVEGLGGVRIEDTVWVGETGTEILTSFPKDLVIEKA